MASDDSLQIKISTSADTKGVDTAKSAISGLQSTTEGVSSKTIALGNLMADAFKKVGGSLLEVGKTAISSASNFEQSRVAFDVMLGDADKARTMMMDISKFAKETPFELPEVVAGSKQLLAYGFAQAQIIPTMRKLGDVAAGVGVPVGQLTNVFGQVKVAGRLMGGELLQFTNAGVPMIEYLAKTMKKPQQEIKNLVEKGKVGFKDVETALNEMTREGGKFGGMMDKQSKTFGGIVSNIKDGFDSIFRTAVGVSDAGDIVQGGLFDKVKKGAEAAIPYINKFKGALDIITTGDLNQNNLSLLGAEEDSDLVAKIYRIREAGEAVKAFYQSFQAGDNMAEAPGIINSFGEAGERLRGIIKSAADIFIQFFLPSLKALWLTISENILPTFKRLWDTVQQFMPAIKVFAQLIGVYVVANIWIWINVMNVAWKVLGFIINVWIELAERVVWAVALVINTAQDMYNAWIRIWQGLQDRVRMVFDSIKLIINTLPLAMNHVKDQIYNAMTDPFLRAYNFINDIVGKIKSAVEGIKDFGGTAVNKVSGAGSKVKSWVPGFAGGTNYAPGGMALVGEQGPELVNLPRGSKVSTASQTKGMMGGTTTVNYNAPIYLSTPEATREFFKVQDRNGVLAGKGLSVVRV